MQLSTSLHRARWVIAFFLNVHRQGKPPPTSLTRPSNYLTVRFHFQRKGMVKVRFRLDVKSWRLCFELCPAYCWVLTGFRWWCLLIFAGYLGVCWPMGRRNEESRPTPTRTRRYSNYSDCNSRKKTANGYSRRLHSADYKYRRRSSKISSRHRANHRDNIKTMVKGSQSNSKTKSRSAKESKNSNSKKFSRDGSSDRRAMAGEEVGFLIFLDFTIGNFKWVTGHTEVQMLKLPNPRLTPKLERFGLVSQYKKAGRCALEGFEWKVVKYDNLCIWRFVIGLEAAIGRASCRLRRIPSRSPSLPQKIEGPSECCSTVQMTTSS